MLKLLISTTVLSSPNWPPFCYSFVSSISVLPSCLSHSVQLTSPSSPACVHCFILLLMGLYVTTWLELLRADLIKSRLNLFRGRPPNCTILRCHHVVCSCFCYSVYNSVCYPTYLCLYKTSRITRLYVGALCIPINSAFFFTFQVMVIPRGII